MIAMLFSQFLEQKFIEFQTRKGKRQTVAQFAAYIGVKPSTLSMWWNSNVEPGGESIRMLAEKLGIEVYDVLGLDRPDEDLHYIQRHWEDLPPSMRRSLREQAEKYSLANQSRKNAKRAAET